MSLKFCISDKITDSFSNSAQFPFYPSNIIVSRFNDLDDKMYLLDRLENNTGDSTKINFKGVILYVESNVNSIDLR